MNGEDWIERWQEGRIGWHEPAGNRALKAQWPEFGRRPRVFVPLCGKSVDMLWLAGRGADVTGIELSERAVRAFFAENRIDFEIERGRLPCYRAIGLPIRVYCGDFFELRGAPFDALYDRGALVAMPVSERPRYVRHMKTLLAPDAYRLVITLEYDQARAAGPPWCVPPAEMSGYWPDMRRVDAVDDLQSAPPKFRQAGLDEFVEAVWSSPPPPSGGD